MRARGADDAQHDAVHLVDHRADLIARLQLQGGSLIGGHTPDLAGSIAQQRLGRRISQHAAFLQNHQAIGNGLHIADDVGTQDNHPRTGQAGQQVAEAHALGGVEACCRLIDNQQLRVVEQRLRNADTLLHAAGIGGQPAIGHLLHLHNFQHLIDAPVRDGLGQPLHRGQIAQKLPPGEFGIDAELLGKIAQHLPQRLTMGADVLPVPVDGPLAGLQQRRNHAHQGRFACAIGANQSQHAWLAAQ